MAHQNIACPPQNLIGQTIYVNQSAFSVQDQLGEGGLATIFNVSSNLGQFAMKRMLVGESQDEDVLRSARNEVKIMKRFASCDNIVTLVESKETRVRSLQGNVYVFLSVMEKCEKSVLDMMREHRRMGKSSLDQSTVIHIMHDVIRGLLQLHLGDPSTAHRDVKVENVLYDRRRNLYKLCDFGSATTEFGAWGKAERLVRQNKVEDIERNTTVEYRAPEQCSMFHSHVIDERVDAWALGVMLFRIIFFQLPFDGSSSLQVMNGDFKFPRKVASEKKFRVMIKRLLVTDPNDRMTCVEALEKLCSLGNLKEPVEVAAALERARSKGVNCEGDSSENEKRGGKSKKKVKKKKKKKKKKNTEDKAQKDASIAPAVEDKEEDWSDVLSGNVQQVPKNSVDDFFGADPNAFGDDDTSFGNFSDEFGDKNFGNFSAEFSEHFDNLSEAFGQTKLDNDGKQAAADADPFSAEWGKNLTGVTESNRNSQVEDLISFDATGTGHNQMINSNPISSVFGTVASGIPLQQHQQGMPSPTSSQLRSMTWPGNPAVQHPILANNFQQQFGNQGGQHVRMDPFFGL